MTHPCADHPCDHCYLCDVVGICCQTVPNATSIQADDRDAALLTAILAERHKAADLAALIHAELTEAKQDKPAPAPPLLPIPSPVPLLPIHHHAKGIR